MLLVKRGAGRYEEMPKELKSDLISLATGMTFKEFTSQKRPFEFKMKGSKGYKDAKWKTVYNRGRALPIEYNIRHNGETLKLAYCHSIEEVRQGSFVEQKLRSDRGLASSQNLGLMFLTGAKRLNIPVDDYEKALFVLLYAECKDSPFRSGNSSGSYEWVRHEIRAKNQYLKQMEVIEVQNKIMFEIDIFTLKSYAQSLGAVNVEHMEEEEVRMLVLNDAVRNIDQFKIKLNSSTFNLSGDVLKIYESGVLKHQRVDQNDIWSYGKGDLIGNIIASLRAETGEDRLRGITRYLFENPSTFDTLKSIFFEVTGVKNGVLESAGKTLSQTDSLVKVEELIAEGKIYPHKPTRRVFVKYPDDTKEVILEEVDFKVWKESVGKYMDENPDVLAQISE